MEAVRLLPQSKILQEWWQEVKDNFWEGDAKGLVKEILKKLMESTMVREIAQKTEVGYYKNNPQKRQDYRNGYYERAFVTQFGIIQGIKTPRTRKGGFRTKVFRRDEEPVYSHVLATGKAVRESYTLFYSLKQQMEGAPYKAFYTILLTQT